LPFSRIPAIVLFVGVAPSNTEAHQPQPTKPMLEFQLVIRHQHHDNHIPCSDFWDGRSVWWGPGAERKALAASKKLNKILPGFHYSEVVSTFVA